MSTHSCETVYTDSQDMLVLSSTITSYITIAVQNGSTSPKYYQIPVHILEHIRRVNLKLKLRKANNLLTVKTERICGKNILRKAINEPTFRDIENEVQQDN